MTFGDLASDLGLSKSGLFAHFNSKLQLQLDVLALAAEHFTRRVFIPALKKPRGKVRLRAIFERWLDWVQSAEPARGCVFLSGAVEWADREGPVRDTLVAWFDELYRGLGRAVSIAVDEGHFAEGLDGEQFVGELHAVVLKFHLDVRLLRKRGARARALRAFERLCRFAEAGTGSSAG